MKALETLTRNFRRRLTGALINSSAKPRSWSLLRTLSSCVAQCATKLCYCLTADRSILATWTKRSNDTHMGLASRETFRGSFESTDSTVVPQELTADLR